MGKFVRWDVLDGRLLWNFDQDKIVAEKLFDGCYIVSGEVPKEKMAASEVVASYKKLGLVEEAFRSLKTVQLEVRPVYHKTDDRIRSHVFLCTLAYYLQWHLKQRLEPLFAADGTHKDRQWTVRNVIERLAAIRRDKIVTGVTWSSRKSPYPNPSSKRSSIISKCACSHILEIRKLFKLLLDSRLHSERKRKCVKMVCDAVARDHTAHRVG